MGSFAADQVIGPDNLFQDAVRKAVYTAAAGKIVTIGIKPTIPPPDSATSVPARTSTSRPAECESVVEFVEEPSEEVAEE